MKQIKMVKELNTAQLLFFILGLGCMLALWITRLNLVVVISVGFCAIAALLIFLTMIFKGTCYLWLCLAYASSLFGLISHSVFNGADAGFGAFSSGLAGFSTLNHPWLTGPGNFGTRLLGNLLLTAPSIILLVLAVVLSKQKEGKSPFARAFFARLTSFLLILSTIALVLTMNLRMKPQTTRLWEGQEVYLEKIDNNRKTSNAPNVIFIMVDDLGYGDISAMGSLIPTPNIDRLADEGVSFENFYSSYSVCSPARFAALTGRYPYRGYADNVIFPTIATLSPFADTRIFNSVEMGANVDGMLGDEISIAETLKAAGYQTGLFGKWHLGDYGEYLPTNQGFDYFYGSHHVNDMTPFYHVSEVDGQYEIVKGIDDLRDQKDASAWIHEEIDSWVRDAAKSEQPFFAFYASPWPHAPIFVGDAFKGKTGLGDYADCVAEFDYYLGLLFTSLEELDILDDTLIIFTSDNGPALQGSTADLRGGKYLPYEGGQKVPFLMRWANNPLFEPGTTRSAPATFVDLYPTFVALCGVTANDGKEKAPLPQDRIIDGTSMLPVLQDDSPIHTKENPILYMKREKLRAIQYAIDTKDLLSREPYKDYKYSYLKEWDSLNFKYFKRTQNDNSAFFDMFRKHWLHLLNDDVGENYNRTSVFPELADEMKETLDENFKNLRKNRRGIL